MCQKRNSVYHNPYEKDFRIDPCMREEIKEFNKAIKLLEPYLSNKLRICACCCGHGKYKKSIILKEGKDSDDEMPSYFEHFSKIKIPRCRNFYKRDDEGYYYLPELIHIDGHRQTGSIKGKVSP